MDFLIGLGLVSGVSILVQNFCDNSTLSPWLQGFVALPCFPLLWGLLIAIGFWLMVDYIVTIAAKES